MIQNLNDFAESVDYSLMNTLVVDPTATNDGEDHSPREVISGHYVPVKPEPIDKPVYISHSRSLFEELDLSDELANDEAFMKVFSGDLSEAPEPMKQYGWSCGYALSIYGSEYYDQCPFKTGNGYGDGRAISVFEGVFRGKRWEMQLKGGGRSPYCRGADGRAVLRSSVREFLAQEHMHALGLPTSRSLTLYASQSETVQRPWFRENSHSYDPEVLIKEFVAISTRVAPSFLRVGQVELFGRRARKQEHEDALKELKDIVLHLIDREYPEIMSSSLEFNQKVLQLAKDFRTRLCKLVADWIRVGYCQGNFNSDNCAAGGFTLDYGPFGFIDLFDPKYNSWTMGGLHFSFLNQPQAAEQNFKMFCNALKPLLESNETERNEVETILNEFPKYMQKALGEMWASKLGLNTLKAGLVNDLFELMIETQVDYTIFFRELSEVPDSFEALKKSFYKNSDDDQELLEKWSNWFKEWLETVRETNPIEINASSEESAKKLSEIMKKVNPKYSLREWFLVPAYKEANKGNYSLIEELRQVMTDPYSEQSKEVEDKFYKLKPSELFKVAGVSHVSCSS